MHSPRPAAEWAKNLVVDQIHGQYACECQYISKMCHHHEFQVTAISNALDAYARQQVEAEQKCPDHEGHAKHYCALCVSEAAEGHAKYQVEAFRERAVQVASDIAKQGEYQEWADVTAAKIAAAIRQINL